MVGRFVGWAIAIAILVFIIVQTQSTDAQALQSTNYKFDESSVGVDTLEQSTSSSYQSSSATSNLTVGNSSSTNYQVESGTITPHDPTLSFYISDVPANFGTFSATTAATATASFSVSNYTSYGYAVQIFGDPPSYGSHIIDAMTETGPSVPGTQQFGINLVANTSPISFGSNPDNGQFGFGSVTTNYSTANSFRYVSGETIATSSKSSGKTSYTISYIVNVDNLTIGGQYTSNQTIIVTGTY
jgi:hypothetical protein